MIAYDDPRTGAVRVQFLLWIACCAACGSSPGGGGAADPDAGAPDAAVDDEADVPDAAAGEPDAAPAPADLVAVEQGLLRGTEAGETWSFRAIPYAAPPEGDRRWRAPEPPLPWEGERDATEFGEPCVQVAPDRDVIGSEDCLTLNVWTPRERPADAMPVLVFLHGGQNLAGSASGQTFIGDYDGQFLARRGPAVVITANYRLGAFGWLTHPALEDPEHGSAGNYALLDQIEALRWVSRNVAAFGGDPSRVMLFGQSAGSVDTCSLVASPLAEGLFSSALMQSGSCWTYDATADATADGAARALDCEGDRDAAACMRSRTAEEVARVPGGSIFDLVWPYFYGPVIDGWVLPDQPVAMMRDGRHNHVALVFGTNADELTTALGGPAGGLASEEAYREAVEREVGPLADEVLGLYPSSDYPSRGDALVAILGDWWYHCPARRAARAARENQEEPVWRYVYAHTIEDRALRAFRAGHALELQFVFGDFWEFTPTEEERTLSNNIMDAWLRFAATGDPNADGAPVWPAYDAITDPYAILDEPMGHGEGYRTELCDFWDAND